MKQVLQTRNGVTVVRDVPAPPCPPGSVLVRNRFSVISSGTERSRVALSQKSLLGKARERPDLVRQVVDHARREGIAATRRAVQTKLSSEAAVGYSSAGEVVEVGARVPGIAAGDLVACCGAGHANHAELVAIPRNLVAKVPEGVRLETAAMSTIAAIALHGVRLAEVQLGDRVAVIGCGLVGQIACRLLTAAGAEVFALDIDRARVDAARSGGADHSVVSDGSAAERVLVAAGGIGVDAVLVAAAAPSSEPLLLAAKIARDRGAIVLIGAVPIEFPREPLYDKELSFRVSRSYGPGRYDADYEERGLDYPIGYVRWTEQRNMEAVLDLQARRRLSLDDLIEEVVSVDEAPAAYERLIGPPDQRPRGALVIAYPERTERRLRTPVSARETRKRSDDAIGVALIGPGGFAAKVLVPALVSAGVRLELVAGGSGPSAEAATRSLGFARVADTPESAIDDPDVDAVVVATRHDAHAYLAERALLAGKHVFCEKPLALDADELKRVVAAAAESEGILSVGFNRRFAPFVQQARDFLAPSTGPLTAHYRVSAGHLDPEHWTHDLAQGGGRLIGEACHFVDTLRFLAGCQVVEVYASGFAQPELPVQAADNVSVILRFADGSVGAILYAAEGGHGVPKERLEAFRRGRTAVLDDFRRLELYGPDGRRGETERTPDKGHLAEVAAFVGGTRTGMTPVPLDEIENVSLATLAIVESLRSGRVVRVAGD